MERGSYRYYKKIPRPLPCLSVAEVLDGDKSYRMMDKINIYRHPHAPDRCHWPDAGQEYGQTSGQVLGRCQGISIDGSPVLIPRHWWRWPGQDRQNKWMPFRLTRSPPGCHQGFRVERGRGKPWRKLFAPLYGLYFIWLDGIRNTVENGSWIDRTIWWKRNQLGGVNPAGEITDIQITEDDNVFRKYYRLTGSPYGASDWWQQPDYGHIIRSAGSMPSPQPSPVRRERVKEVMAGNWDWIISIVETLSLAD